MELAERMEGYEVIGGRGGSSVLSSSILDEVEGGRGTGDFGTKVLAPLTNMLRFVATGDVAVGPGVGVVDGAAGDDTSGAAASAIDGAEGVGGV